MSFGGMLTGGDEGEKKEQTEISNDKVEENKDIVLKEDEEKKELAENTTEIEN